MRIPSQQFLTLRALGAPAVVLYLTLQGVFRGFKDTKTPVLCLGTHLVMKPRIMLMVEFISKHFLYYVLSLSFIFLLKYLFLIHRNWKFASCLSFSLVNLLFSIGCNWSSNFYRCVSVCSLLITLLPVFFIIASKLIQFMFQICYRLFDVMVSQ